MYVIKKLYPKSETSDGGVKLLELGFNSMEEFKTNHQKILEKIPEADRQNLFITLDHKDSKEFKQDLLLFDIDGVDESADDAAYLNAFSKACGIDKNKIMQIFSGGGYHFVIQLDKPITNKEYFEKERDYYNLLCSKIDLELHNRGLTGLADTAVFAPERAFRYPSTKNLKRSAWTSLKADHISPVKFDFSEALNMPRLSKHDFIETPKGTNDTKEILKECEFLKFCGAEPASVSESQWYAMLSITSRLDETGEISHSYSKGHPKYSKGETDQKILQSLGPKSGPRTCKNINNQWDGNCQKKCKHFGKLKSPIALKSNTFIASRDTGFHLIQTPANGGAPKYIPQYDDLERHYTNNHPYKNTAKTHLRFEDDHYKVVSDVFIRNFAEVNFQPTCDQKRANEFASKVLRKNPTSEEWFQKSTLRKINLANGVLDIDTMKLTPHSPEFGFFYKLPFNWEPEAKAPTFEKMLNNITKEREGLKQILLEFMGYCLSNDSPKLADKCLILFGAGSNGKSRFLSVLEALGGDAAIALSLADLNNHFHMQLLDGALFNIMEEIPKYSENKIWENLKNLISGGKLTVARKSDRPYTFKNRAKFVMTCNEIPKGGTPNTGLFRKLLVVPFDAKFSHEDGNIDVRIDDKIIASELPGVLRMALEAYHRLRERDYQFSTCTASEAAKEAFMDEIDPMKPFLDDMIEVGEPDAAFLGQSPVKFMRVPKAKRWGMNLDDLYNLYCQEFEDSKKRPAQKSGFLQGVRRYLEVHQKVHPNSEWWGKGANYSQVGVAKGRFRIDGALVHVLMGVRCPGAAEGGKGDLPEF